MLDLQWIWNKVVIKDLTVPSVKYLATLSTKSIHSSGLQAPPSVGMCVAKIRKVGKSDRSSRSTDYVPMLSRDCHEILLIFYVIVSIVCQSTIDILLFILQAYRTFGILVIQGH